MIDDSSVYYSFLCIAIDYVLHMYDRLVLELKSLLGWRWNISKKHTRRQNSNCQLTNCHGNAAKEIEIWISSLVTVHTQRHASNVPVAVSADLLLSPITTVCFSPHLGPGSGAHRHFATQPIICILMQTGHRQSFAISPFQAEEGYCLSASHPGQNLPLHLSLRTSRC